jgi:hypothetical protein
MVHQYDLPIPSHNEGCALVLLHDLHGREDVRRRNGFLAQILLLVPLGAYVRHAGGCSRTAAAAAVAVCIGLIGPAPLVWCIVVVLVFGAPWTFCGAASSRPRRRK